MPAGLEKCLKKVKKGDEGLTLELSVPRSVEGYQTRVSKLMLLVNVTSQCWSM